MRAMRIVVTDAVHPRAGASVDVLASFEDDTTAAPATVVARGVLVLASDDSTRTSEGLQALGVTLLVTPGEARDLAFASTHGVLTITLVPPEDARAG
jgi:Flp pilus assembly protein CpaB